MRRGSARRRGGSGSPHLFADLVEEFLELTNALADRAADLGRFTFTRLGYTTGPGGYDYRGLPAWAHDYNVAEENQMKIMREATALRKYLLKGGFIIFAGFRDDFRSPRTLDSTTGT